MSAVSHARGRVGIGVMHTAMQNNPQAIRTMSAIMLLGRLEIMPLLVLLMPSVWRRK
jgi:Trk-type K+ transport system membrane component